MQLRRLKPTQAHLRVATLAILIVMCTLVILSAIFPFPEGTWGFLSIGTSQKAYANPDWLSDWSYRCNITIDADDIDSDLTWFPVMLNLGTSVGIGSDDVSFIFDELSSNANRKKIAVTEDDGTTQLYVEIERWDDYSESAVLRVSKTGWVADDTVDTLLYFYYDSTHDDNTTYVADAGAAQNVWDSNFIYVNHWATYPFTGYKDAGGVYNDATADALEEPIVIYDTDDSTFKMWVHRIDEADGDRLDYLTSANGVSWSLQGSIADSDGLCTANIWINSDNSTLEVQGAVADDGGAQTDETTEANEATANDMTLLPATPVENDAYYIGGHAEMNSVKLNVDTAGVGTWTITWEYWDGDSWEALSGVSDGSNGFTVSGTNTISYTLPGDWTSKSVDGITAYWIRGRVSSYTSISTQPLGTQAWAVYKYWLYCNTSFNDSPSYQDDQHLYVGGSEMLFTSYATTYPLGSDGSYDDYAICSPSVWKEGSTWRQLVEVFDGPLAVSTVHEAYAYSSDGVTWTKDGSNPCVIDGPPDHMSNHMEGRPAVFKIGSTYYCVTHHGMFYYSTDLHSWYTMGGSNNNIFARTDAKDATYCLGPSILEYGGQTYLYYRMVHTGTKDIGLYLLPFDLTELVNYPASIKDSVGGDDIVVEFATNSYGRIPVDDAIGAAFNWYAGTGATVNYVDIPQADVTSVATFEAYIEPNVQSAAMVIVDNSVVGTSYPNYDLQVNASNKGYFGFYNGATWYGVATSTTLGASTYYLTGTNDGSYVRIYTNGALDCTPVSVTGTPYNLGKNFQVAGTDRKDAGYTYQPFHGYIDELRISNTARPAAWISATYESEMDDLVDWGAEESPSPEITNTPDSNDFGILEVNGTGNTVINYFQIENTGNCAVDVVIYATDATGGDDTWTLSDSATPGENIYGLKCGLDDDDDEFDIIVRKTETYNTIVSDLAEDATQSWGLKIYMPTALSGYDCNEMTATITLVASASS